MRRLPSNSSQMSPATWIQNVAISYIVLWSTSPILAFGTTWRILAVLAVIVFAFTQIFRSESSATNINSLVILLILFYTLYTGIFSFIASGPAGAVGNIQIYIMLFFACVFETRRKDLLSLAPVVWITLLTVPIWQLLTLHEVTFVDPHAARVVVRSGEEAYDLTQAGIGGYGLVYASVLMIPPIMALAFLHPRGPWLPSWLRVRPLLAKSAIFISLAVSAIMIVMSGYSIAVITLTISIFSFVLLRHPSPIRFVLLVAIIAFTVLAWREIVVSIFEIVRPFAQGTNYQIKIDDLMRSIDFADATGSFGDREDRYRRSLELFLENPILGTISIRDVGKHSSILDNFAQWGAFVGFLFVYLIIRPIRAAFSNGAPFGLVAATALSVAAVFGLDNGFASAGVALYILFPVAAALTRERISMNAIQERFGLSPSLDRGDAR